MLSTFLSYLAVKNTCIHQVSPLPNQPRNPRDLDVQKPQHITRENEQSEEN